MIDAGNLEGLSEEELSAQMIAAASHPLYGEYEGEQLGQAIAKVGRIGIRVLERLLDHPSEHVVAGAVHGLGQIAGWSEAHTGILAKLVFDDRPAVIARSLDALTGWDEGDICYLPEIADDVAIRLAGHDSSNVRSAALAYLSICAPDRHFDSLVGGLSDLDPWVRHTAVNRMHRFERSEHLAAAGALVWLRLDDDDIDVRDWAQMQLEAHSWALPESTERFALTDDATLLAYSQTRVDLDPKSGRPFQAHTFARALKSNEATPVRRGAADELWEQSILVDDDQAFAALVAIAADYRDDSDPRVRQAAKGVIDRARDRAHSGPGG